MLYLLAILLPLLTILLLLYLLAVPHHCELKKTSQSPEI